jgi:uncharacterized tellurite resistance protein B-like protein
MTTACAHCHLLAAVLAADGSLGEQERELLERTMERLGLGPEERDQVHHFEGADGAAEALRGQPEAERRALVDELVEAALTDGKLTHAETAAVKRIAAELGLD